GVGARVGRGRETRAQLRGGLRVRPTGQPAADAGENLRDAARRKAEPFGDVALQLAVDDDATENFLVAAGRDAAVICLALLGVGHGSAFLFWTLDFRFWIGARR